MRDFINIGSIGFAQLGSNDYYNKRQIEKKVLMELLENQETFKIPEEINHMCNFGIKRFPYEYDSYDEVVLYYDDDILDEWYEQHDEALKKTDIEDRNVPFDDYVLPVNKCDAFWEFANKAESFDFETEDILKKCREYYAKQHPVTLVHKKEEEKLSPDKINLKKAE